MKNDSLSIRVKSARLGFRPMPPHQEFFLKISHHPTGKFLVEIVPPLFMRGYRSIEKTYVHWWEGEDGGLGLVNDSPVLRSLKEAHQPLAFLLDDQGEYAGACNISKRRGR